MTILRNGSFLLIRQYRPVIAQWTLEFPGGLRISLASIRWYANFAGTSGIKPRVVFDNLRPHAQLGDRLGAMAAHISSSVGDENACHMRDRQVR
jgi:hypothetical protein